MEHIQNGKRALVQDRLNDAQTHFRAAEKIYPKGKKAVEGLALALARQCWEKDRNCEEAKYWLKHAITKLEKNDELWAYLNVIQKKPPV